EEGGVGQGCGTVCGLRELTPAAQARQTAGARHERTLAAVACKPLIMIEASPAAYPGGMLALGKSHSRTRRRPPCDSTPSSTPFTVGSTGMPGVWTSAS